MNAPLMPGGREHSARDGVRLFIRCSGATAGPERGTVLLTHGMGEHSSRYYHVIRRLNATGLRVVAWDLRGHGRSGGARGDIRDYAVLVDDLLEVWGLPEIQASGEPVYLYGHSLGGQITLNFAVRHQPRAAGLIITSPWLRLAFRPPRWKVAIASLAAMLWPTLTQDTEVVPARLSRDQAFLRSMPDPQLVHHRMSARMYHALTAGAARAAREAVHLSYPMLLVHGSRDPVTSAAATEEFFHALESRDKSLIIVPESLHETHNDLCRESVLDQITAWLDARLDRQ
ncbi:MAG TPA: alpha/beta hydrolase [Chthoniobacteraceae bacterium]|jgi:alpha-beta hydrolase superfamily lysophospholipase|nr:alpha/beta hydrolase [Chthoniobacteraceae bacterium]